ncbi:MAG: hypothetical protein H0T79_14725 [Deltaproteobacteria bacterium]|nr:hypothetical protein [Deltaproteobacteria bacterium]
MSNRRLACLGLVACLALTGSVAHAGRGRATKVVKQTKHRAKIAPPVVETSDEDAEDEDAPRATKRKHTARMNRILEADRVAFASQDDDELLDDRTELVDAPTKRRKKPARPGQDWHVAFGPMVLVLVSAMTACEGSMPPPPVLTITSPARGLMQDEGQVVVTGTALPNPDGDPVTPAPRSSAPRSTRSSTSRSFAETTPSRSRSSSARSSCGSTWSWIRPTPTVARSTSPVLRPPASGSSSTR